MAKQTYLKIIMATAVDGTRNRLWTVSYSHGDGLDHRVIYDSDTARWYWDKPGRGIREMDHEDNETFNRAMREYNVRRVLEDLK